MTLTPACRSAAVFLTAAFLSPWSARASLTEYDTLITADAAAGMTPAAKLTNAVTLNGTASSPFNFGAISGDGTFEFILEGTTASAGAYLAVGSNATSNLRFEQWNNTGQLGMTQLGVADYLFTPGIPSPVSPKHITYVWNGSGSMKLYVDGIPAGTNGSIAAGFALPTGAGRLGANPSNGEAMAGTIYRVTCYNTVLTDADILRHADAYHGVLRPPAITAFSVTPPAVVAGTEVTVKWTVTGAQTVTLNGTDVTGQSQAVFTLSAAGSYALAATNANGTTTRTIEVPLIQPAGHVVINEFMAENKSVLADADGVFSDWVELHNPTAAPVNLGGLYLTDDAAQPQKWALPAATLAPGAFRIVFLSSNDRAPVDGEWHTNFRLGKDGEYLALTGPGGVVHAFAPSFPPQNEDVSFGLTGADATLSGFMGHPTPNAPNDPSPPVPARVQFSRVSGILTEPFTLTLSTATTGADIFYRLNNDTAVQAYTGAVNISGGTRVTAWAERYGQRSAESRGAWIKMAAEMASYTSPLPVMVIDNFSAGPITQKGWSGDGSGIMQVPQQPAVWAVWERSGATATPSGTPQMVSGIGIRGRGAFSSSWRQKPYAVEAWNSEGAESDVSVLGMPAHSDWILYFPDPDDNKDPSLLFNTFVYELSKRCGRYAPRFRWVELFVNEDGGDLGLSDRRGVYAVLEKVSRGPGRLDFDKLSDDGTTGGWLTNINRMDAAPEDGFPAANGATSPQFFRTAGANRIQQTAPNVAAVVGDDQPQQSNGFLNFDNPGGYAVTTAQRAAIEGWFRSFEDVLYNNTLWRDPANGYRKWLDDRDFAEYFIFNELTRNGDGMLISMFPWKGNDGKLRMGPAWDYNWASYHIGGTATGNLRWRGDRIWYGRLFADPDFLQLFIDRWSIFRRGPMSNAGMDAIIDAQAAEITPAKAVLQGIPSAAAFTSRLTTMKNWLHQRAEVVDAAYRRPPVFSVPGGIVASGTEVALTAPAGTIYRTLDGTDPRQRGGTVAPAAAVGNTVTITADTKLHARVQGSPQWSGPTVAVYVPDAVEATAANLAVSEILYHPADATAAETAAGFTNQDDFEFIEVVNFSAQKVSLAGVSFTAGDLGEGVGFAFNDGTVWSLPAGGRAVIVKNRAAFAQRYPGVAVAGEFSGQLNNAGDLLTLTGASGHVIASIPFGDNTPWPKAADGDGYSLTFAAPGSAPADAAHWRSSIASGGSPGTGDSVPYNTGDDLLAYALGSHLPRWARTAGGLTILQQSLPGTDAVILTLEHSPDLLTWTAAPAASTEVLRTGGDFTTRWTLTDAPMQFVRVRVTLR